MVAAEQIPLPVQLSQYARNVVRGGYAGTFLDMRGPPQLLFESLVFAAMGFFSPTHLPHGEVCLCQVTPYSADRALRAFLETAGDPSGIGCKGGALKASFKHGAEVRLRRVKSV